MKKKFDSRKYLKQFEALEEAAKAEKLEIEAKKREIQRLRQELKELEYEADALSRL